MYQSFIHDLTYHKHMTNKCNWEKKDIHVPIYTYTISHTVNIWQTNVIVMGKKKKQKKTYFYKYILHGKYIVLICKADSMMNISSILCTVYGKNLLYGRGQYTGSKTREFALIRLRRFCVN